MEYGDLETVKSDDIAKVWYMKISYLYLPLENHRCPLINEWAISKIFLDAFISWFQIDLNACFAQSKTGYSLLYESSTFTFSKDYDNTWLLLAGIRDPMSSDTQYWHLLFTCPGIQRIIISRTSIHRLEHNVRIVLRRIVIRLRPMPHPLLFLSPNSKPND